MCNRFEAVLKMGYVSLAHQCHAVRAFIDSAVVIFLSVPSSLSCLPDFTNASVRHDFLLFGSEGVFQVPCHLMHEMIVSGQAKANRSAGSDMARSLGIHSVKPGNACR